jgi:hypothetical protein
MPRNRKSSEGLEAFADTLQRAKSESEMREILCHLSDAMATSVAAAPVRTQAYRLGRAGSRAGGTDKSAWLRAMWNEYGSPRATSFDLLFCDQLLGLEVALGDQGPSQASEHVDLLGVARMERTPVVIELADPERQTVPRALLRAVSCALSIKKAWPHRLRGDWGDALRSSGLGEPRLPIFLGSLRVFVAAPAAFWDVRPREPANKRRANTPSVWRALTELDSALRRQDVWPSFVRLQVEETRLGQPFRVSSHTQAVPAA